MMPGQSARAACSVLASAVLSIASLAHASQPAAHAAEPALAQACQLHRPSLPKHSFPEEQGVTTQGTLWALLFYHPPAQPRTDLKIALRMTGSGPLHVEVDGLHGEVLHPMWGPEIHSGSSWNKPGNEWGTGWRIPATGCWRIHATRHGAKGNIWLQVGRP